MTAAQLSVELRRHASARDARQLQRFFKTGPGEYGEGDVFLGVRMPAIRKVARAHRATPLRSVLALLKSRYHEERMLALLIMVLQFKGGALEQQRTLYQAYMSHTGYINNWDLVDLSAEHIPGAYLFNRSRKPLYRFARARSLWERRIAVLSTFHFIKAGDYSDTLYLAERLLPDKEDLIHKAVGWMLREVGARDRAVEEAFLLAHCREMPRTMLRYSLEHFPERRRRLYMRGTPP
jgi:3-methyladenine DNA glycosylase AlkD